MAWIESHQSLARHPKTRRLCRSLEIEVPQAVGHLHLLWWWALDYAPDGDLESYDDADLADACGWTGDAARLRSALELAGFVTDGHIHDWGDYTGRLVGLRARSTARQARCRERNRSRCSGDDASVSQGCHGDVTRDSRVTHALVTGDLTDLTDRTKNTCDVSSEVVRSSVPDADASSSPAGDLSSPPAGQEGATTDETRESDLQDSPTFRSGVTPPDGVCSGYREHVDYPGVCSHLAGSDCGVACCRRCPNVCNSRCRDAGRPVEKPPEPVPNDKAKDKKSTPEELELIQFFRCEFRTNVDPKYQKWQKEKRIPDSERDAARYLLKHHQSDVKRVIRWTVRDKKTPRPPSTWQGWHKPIKSLANLTNHWSELEQESRMAQHGSGPSREEITRLVLEEERRLARERPYHAPPMPEGITLDERRAHQQRVDAASSEHDRQLAREAKRIVHERLGVQVT